MFIKLDDNLSDTYTEFLRQMGYEWDRVTDEGLSGANDEVVWQQVFQEHRVLNSDLRPSRTAIPM